MPKTENGNGFRVVREEPAPMSPEERRKLMLMNSRLWKREF